MNRIITVTLNPAFDLHYYMESFEAKRENYVQGVVCDVGGKGINISRALHVNGAESLALVILGRENGAAFAAQLDRDGVCYRAVEIDGRIRENITLHPQNDRETRISLDTFAVNEACVMQMEQALLQSVSEGDLVAFAGRLPKGLSKERAIELLLRLKEKGARLVVDSNSLTPKDLQAIKPWIIKPNEQEIEAFLGHGVKDATEAAEAARELVLRGVAEEVMISLGGDGAAWSDGSERIILSVPRLAHPVSTIGAGDSTLAGLLAATAQGKTKEEALCQAVAFGTAACMTEGTKPPLPEDVVRVLEDARATRL